MIPLEGSPACPSTTVQFKNAISGLGLSGGVVDDIPIVCGESGVDYQCQKLELGANRWVPVDSGVRFFESAMTVINDGSDILAIGGR